VVFLWTTEEASTRRWPGLRCAVMRGELASCTVSRRTVVAGSTHKELRKASELQNRAGSGVLFSCCFFSQQVGRAPETSGRQPVLLAHLTLITGVWREGRGRGEKQPAHQGWGSRTIVCVCVCVCLFVCV